MDEFTCLNKKERKKENKKWDDFSSWIKLSPFDFTSSLTLVLINICR